ncbi:spore coat protein GerQ [Ammoniphilus sp. CFH 90114]|nr:spore coat protein GerQ [Ammoniphilus sp. CFH 90114]
MPKPTPMPMPFPQQPMLPTQQAFGFPGQPFAPTPVFPPQAAGAMIPGTMAAPTAPTIPGMLPLEQSYIENILRLNRGKVGTFYFTYENNNQWNAKVYRGVIEAAGRDHIILSDPQTGARYLLLMVNFDYATFDSELNYEYPFGGGTYGGVSPVPTTATPR